jgi:hypothetical protein
MRASTQPCIGLIRREGDDTDGELERYQPPVSGPPLNGPAISLVIHPP